MSVAQEADEETRRSGGNYRERITDPSKINVQDFENPWNFYYLFGCDEGVVNDWLQRNGLLPVTLTCETVVNGGKCGGFMTLKPSANLEGGKLFRCRNNRDHRKTLKAYSFFEGSNLKIQDIMVFMKSYLDKCTLLQCSKFSGIAYGSTGVDWGSFMRELFLEHYVRTIKNLKLHGEIEIDESLFGRRVKFHRGNPNKGMKVWIFGLVERRSNQVILYPVADRREVTLIPVIQRHVEPGSTIYSDGWSAYCNLNDLGYRHFTVIHKYAFKKVYRNVETGQLVSVHTNKIEGAWTHAKMHFRKMAGTQITQFEGHLAEIMWRSQAKGNIYSEFFELLKSVYTLEKPAEYQYRFPVFDTWSGGSVQDSVEPSMSDAESMSESEDNDEADRTLISSNQAADLDTTLRDTTITERPSTSNARTASQPAQTGRVRQQEHVCHPQGFVEEKRDGPRTKTTKRKHPFQRRSNPYSRDAFVDPNWSDDDDFQQ